MAHDIAAADTSQQHLQKKLIVQAGDPSAYMSCTCAADQSVWPYMSSVQQAVVTRSVVFGLPCCSSSSLACL